MVPTAPRPWRPVLTALGFAFAGLLGACTPETPPQARRQGPRPDACLQGVTIEKLERAIRQCNAVVKAHPRHPQPRNDRALLLSLAGRNRAACRDSQAAADLLRRQPARPPTDPLLAEEIRLRQTSCQRWTKAQPAPLTTPPADGAPSPAAAAAPGR